MQAHPEISICSFNRRFLPNFRPQLKTVDSGVLGDVPRRFVTWVLGSISDTALVTALCTMEPHYKDALSDGPGRLTKSEVSE